MEIKHGNAIELEDKAISEDAESWVLTGYASTYAKDLAGDQVVPGAKSLAKHGLPLILFNHKYDECPIGVCVDAHENKRGLWIKAELPKDDTFCRDRLVPQLRRKGIRGLSIGYKTLQSERRKSDGVRLLKEIRLFEVSVTAMPCNPEASVETIKHLAHGSEMEQLLHDGKAFCDELEAFYDELRPNRALVREIRALARAIVDESKE